MRVISRGGHGLAGRGPEPAATAGGSGWEVFKVFPNLFHGYSNYSSMGLSEILSAPPLPPSSTAFFFLQREKGTQPSSEGSVCVYEEALTWCGEEMLV